MKILVVGAAGKTGEAIVQQALAAGHTVTAFVHDAKEFVGEGARVIEGDVLDAAVVDKAVEGQEAVLDALGGHTPWKQTSLDANAARNLIASMHRHGVKRLLVVGPSGRRREDGTGTRVPGRQRRNGAQDYAGRCRGVHAGGARGEPLHRRGGEHRLELKAQAGRGKGYWGGGRGH